VHPVGSYYNNSSRSRFTKH